MSRESLIKNIRETAKSNYYDVVNCKNEMMLDNRIDSKTKELMLKIIDARIFIYCGLYHINKIQFDKGMNKFKKYKMPLVYHTSNIDGFDIDDIDNYKPNIDLQKNYDELLHYSKFIFEEGSI